MNPDISALFDKAHQLQQQGRLPEALSCYEQLLKISPHHIEALHFLGLIHAELEDFYQAKRLLLQALKLKPSPNIHNNLANVYKRSHKLDQAVLHYQEAIRLNPHYAEAHHNLAGIYAELGEYQKALQHYRTAIHSEPSSYLAHYHLGLLLLKNNELAGAKKQFLNVLALYPNHLNAAFYLGALFLESNELNLAERSFQNVLMLDSEHVEALTNLGVIALKKENAQLAIDYFTKALALDNQHLEARNNIAATFMHHDRFENALVHYDILLQKNPYHIEYLYNAGVAQMALGHLKEASAHFKTIITIEENHFAALNNLAAIHIRLGERLDAIKFLEHAVMANPKDEASQFMLNALTGRESLPRASTTYVANLFNNYALYYDQHLQKTLQYTLPYKIAQLLHQLLPKQVQDAIDLGCGTGLSGNVIREWCQHLTGVDLSSKMLAEARNKAIYDVLIESELISFLQQDTKQYDLIIAADVLPYLGDLRPLWMAISSRLNAHGLFVFTHEISEHKSWQLDESCRFKHHPDYIQTLCNELEFHIIHQEKIPARQQNGQPLFVMLDVLRKPLKKQSSKSALRACNSSDEERFITEMQQDRF